ncbi:MAG: cytochrome c3 family protein [Bacteroidota bacterium]
MKAAFFITSLVVFTLIVAPPLHAQKNDQCLACHGESSLTMEKKGKTVSLFVDAASFKRSAHAELECVSCHEGLNPEELPHARKVKAADCLTCHGGEKLAHYKESVHGVTKKGGKPAAACSDCHSTHAVQTISDKDTAALKEFGIGICAKCHGEVKAQYMASNHGLALEAGVKGAPTCIECHGEHEVQLTTSEGATTSHKKVAAMCLSCHLDNPEVRAKVGPSAGFVSSYEKSVHGQAVQSGNDKAATCTDCHGSHEMKKGADAGSKVGRKNIAATCGKCHGDIAEQYNGSIHGKTIAAGVDASATCTDCHGEHNILAHTDERSPVAAQNVSAKVCSPCHA